MNTTQLTKKTKLYVNDIYKTALYYQDILNFKILKHENNKLVLARDDFKFELIKKDSEVKLNCQICDLIWFLPSLDEFYEEIVLKKEKFKNKLIATLEEKIYGQRQIEIIDCDGHKILISE